MHLSLLVLSLTLTVPEFFHSHPLDIGFQYLIDFSYRKTICIPVPKCNYFGRRPKHLISNDVFSPLYSANHLVFYRVTPAVSILLFIATIS